MGKLDVLIKDFNKDFKEEIAFKGIPIRNLPLIPFSSIRVNYMTYGGIPRGRIIEFAGEEGGGKTTTALDIVANAQKLFLQEFETRIQMLQEVAKPTKATEAEIAYLRQRGVKQIVYIDCENTLDEEWARLLGVDTEKITILKPLTQTAEQIFEMALTMIETDEVGLLVIDSLGVMLSAQAYEKSMEEKTYGGIAMALTLFSKKAEMACAKYDCTLIGINQMRDNLDPRSFESRITTGGKAWKHNCSMRLMFQKGSFIDAAGNEVKRGYDTPEGNLVQIDLVKTKVCKPNRRSGFYTLSYFNGVDTIADLVATGIQYGLIQQSGSWFVFVDENGVVIDDESGEAIKLQGKVKVIEYLKDPGNRVLKEELELGLLKKLKEY